MRTKIIENLTGCELKDIPFAVNPENYVDDTECPVLKQEIADSEVRSLRYMKQFKKGRKL